MSVATAWTSPDAALVAPPVAGLLVVGNIGVETVEYGAHCPGLLDRHGVVLEAVKDVHTMVQVVANQVACHAGLLGAGEYRVDRIVVGERRPAGVGEETRPAGARADRREAVRKRHAQMPYAVTAHRVTGQVHTPRVGPVATHGEVEHLQCVDR